MAQDRIPQQDRATAEGVEPDPDAQVVRTPREIRIVLSGLLIAMLLAMLDNMIVGTAMPTIVGDLGGVNHLSWVVTSYILATTASTPIWGKLGDLYGRKGIFMASIVIFLAGSALSGISQNMNELIGSRAIQGLGAGGLIVGVMSIMGALVPPRERGKYQGMFAAVMAVAMIGGPLVGGTITDHLNWHWIFFINLPLGALALVVIAITLHLPKRRSKAKIDYLGAALLTVGIVALVLVTTWGGQTYTWGSWQIAGTLALAAVALAGFFQVEQRVAQRGEEPVLPLHVFRDRNFSLVCGLGFVVGFVMFGAITFLPLYQQSVQGASATNSGLLLMPMMLGMLVVSLVVGQAVTRTGRYKIYPVVGTLVMTAGMLLLSQLDVHTTRTTSALFMVVLGAGMGFLMQITMLVAQNSVPLRDIGVASSSSTFFRSIGGSFGVSLFGALFSSRVTSTMAQRLGASGSQAVDGHAQLSPAMLGRLPAPVRDAYDHAVAGGVHSIFLWGALFSVAGIVVAVFLEEVPLRATPGAAAETAGAVQSAVAAEA
ncbi:MDR family MFS transporter [Streptacidiphilus sp. N1-3]|uniref:MDR family MFS transporter n=1 Tax=Streptacidiphilus alkalitolerans TaxID=3342712 RepID=A0ABV6WXS2_9ACTN